MPVCFTQMSLLHNHFVKVLVTIFKVMEKVMQCLTKGLCLNVNLHSTAQVSNWFINFFL